MMVVWCLLSLIVVLCLSVFAAGYVGFDCGGLSVSVTGGLAGEVCCCCGLFGGLLSVWLLW